MTPFQQFCNGLHQIRSDTNGMLDEMIAFAEVMARKQNSLEMDGDQFYVTAAGTLEEVIPTLRIFLDRLERMKKQKDQPFDR